MTVSVEEFLTELSEALRLQDGVDAELATILQAHILRETPADTCVADAKAAIEELASSRATASLDG